VRLGYVWVKRKRSKVWCDVAPLCLGVGERAGLSVAVQCHSSVSTVAAGIFVQGPGISARHELVLCAAAHFAASIESQAGVAHPYGLSATGTIASIHCATVDMAAGFAVCEFYILHFGVFQS